MAIRPDLEAMMGVQRNKRGFVPVVRVAAVGALFGGFLVVGATGAGAAPVVTEYDTPGEETYVVPAGVCSVTVQAYGAQGGGSLSALRGGGISRTIGESEGSGLGGSTKATLDVVPGEDLIVVVGGQGAMGDAEVTTSPLAASATAGAGGFNGGADGAGTTSVLESDGLAVAAASGGGGGASDVRQGGAGLADRAVVAGGGGGNGSYGQGINSALDNHSNEGGPGGDGGAPEGAAGGDAPGAFGGDGGGGGTQTAGGLGSNDGTLGAGGEGASLALSASSPVGGYVSVVTAGGGGGGLYGGGGGEVDDSGPSPFDQDGGGGGGGGSGFGPAGSIFDDGVREGDGLVRISYDLDDGDGCDDGSTTTSTTTGVAARAAAAAGAVTPRFTG